MSTAVVTRPRREDLPAGECLCSYCTAKCCKYFALPMETPTDARRFRVHPLVSAARRATVFTEEDDLVLAGPHDVQALAAGQPLRHL